MRPILIGFLLLFGAAAFAEPATFNSVVPPTFSQPADGAPDGYRLYEGCDVTTQAKGALIDGAYTSGKAYSITGDTNSPPTLCVVAYNGVGEGAFDVAWRLDVAVVPVEPGPVMNLVPGSCEVVSGTSNEFTCSFTVLTQ